MRADYVVSKGRRPVYRGSGMKCMFNELGGGKEEQSKSVAGEKRGSEKECFWWEREN